MELTLKSENTPFQVDGEPWVQLGGTVTLNPGNPVGVLPGPHFNHASRKNATFFGNDSSDNTDDQIALPQGVMDDIQVGSPHTAGSDQLSALGPELGATRPPASFG